MTQQNDAEAAAPLSVTVVRSGGIAGLIRRWQVQPEASEVPFWEDLVARCPWNDPVGATGRGRRGRPLGADRFSWTVSVRCGARHDSADLGEQDIDGPWRALIDAVRTAESSVAPPEK